MPKQEKWLDEVTSAAEEVLKKLGDIQYTEAVYEEALCHELRIRGVPYERQRNFELIYKGYKVGSARCDFIINPYWATKGRDEHVLEIKAQKKITESHIRQAQVYMISLNIMSGAVLNFVPGTEVGVELLEKSDVKPVSLKVSKPKRRKTSASEKILKQVVKEVCDYFGSEFIYRESTNLGTYISAMGIELELRGISYKYSDYPIMYKCQPVDVFSVPFLFEDGSVMVVECYKKGELIEERMGFYQHFMRKFKIGKIFLCFIPLKADDELKTMSL